MKSFAAMLTFFTLVGSLHAADMVVTRNGSQPSVTGATATFTGSVRNDPLFDATQWHPREPQPASSPSTQALARPGTPIPWVRR
jgi:hypothetical protein